MLLKTVWSDFIVCTLAKILNTIYCNKNVSEYWLVFVRSCKMIKTTFTALYGSYCLKAQINNFNSKKVWWRKSLKVSNFPTLFSYQILRYDSYLLYKNWRKCILNACILPFKTNEKQVVRQLMLVVDSMYSYSKCVRTLWIKKCTPLTSDSN